MQVQAEASTVGFEQNDLAQALMPIQAAVETVISAQAELDKLIDQVRSDAKRKWAGRSG